MVIDQPTEAPEREDSESIGDPNNWCRRIAAELTHSVGDVPVLLAGSRAIGTAGSDSDFDVAVVLPLRRIPRAVPRLAAASGRLSAELGVHVSVNPVPTFRMRRPRGSLFVRKLRAEGVVLAAPRGWSLHPEPVTDVTEFAASSVLLSAVGNLLEAFDTFAMRREVIPVRGRHALRKAALHVAQVRLLGTSRYASDLDTALAMLRNTPSNGGCRTSGEKLSATLTAAIMAPDVIEGFLILRNCVLAELAKISDAPFSLSMARSLVRNAQYVLVARLRGRSRWRSIFTRTAVEATLAASLVALLQALNPQSANGLDIPWLHRAVDTLPLTPDIGGLPHWEDARDLALTEWSDAHPLVGLMS